MDRNSALNTQLASATAAARRLYAPVGETAVSRFGWPSLGSSEARAEAAKYAEGAPSWDRAAPDAE
jgi:hypothetical protein